MTWQPSSRTLTQYLDSTEPSEWPHHAVTLPAAFKTATQIDSPCLVSRNQHELLQQQLSPNTLRQLYYFMSQTQQQQQQDRCYEQCRHHHQQQLQQQPKEHQDHRHFHQQQQQQYMQLQNCEHKLHMTTTDAKAKAAEYIKHLPQNLLAQLAARMRERALTTAMTAVGQLADARSADSATSAAAAAVETAGLFGLAGSAMSATADGRSAETYCQTAEGLMQAEAALTTAARRVRITRAFTAAAAMRNDKSQVVSSATQQNAHKHLEMFNIGRLTAAVTMHESSPKHRQQQQRLCLKLGSQQQRQQNKQLFRQQFKQQVKQRLIARMRLKQQQ